MSGVDWAQPWFLLVALFAVPAFFLARWSSGHVVFSSLRALPAGGTTWRTALVWVPDAFLALSVVALAIALAGPRKGDQDARIRRDGIAIMMAVDISGSMRALDLSEPNRELSRLDAVKQVFARFVNGGAKLDGRPDDAIGLVAFAHYAETRSPLTLDHDNLTAAARQLDFAPENEDGTAIGNGLELAVQRLVDFPASSKIVILLTDGESNITDDGHIDEQTAIDDAVKAGVKVFAIGAGTKGRAQVRVPIGNGQSILRPIEVSIDEGMLRKIADKTGGQYFRATDHESLERIYDSIDKLTRSTFEQDKFTAYHQFYDRFIVVAMILLVAGLALRGSVFRRLP